MKKNQRKLKRGVKGMTLIECIISILVVGVTATIMVTICTSAMNHLSEANRVNNKVNAEAPVAAVQDVAQLNNATVLDSNGNPIIMNANDKQTVTFTVTAGKTYSVTADRYDTNVMARRSNRDTTTQFNADLRFYDVQPTTTAPGP